MEDEKTKAQVAHYESLEAPWMGELTAKYPEFFGKKRGRPCKESPAGEPKVKKLKAAKAPKEVGKKPDIAPGSPSSPDEDESEEEGSRRNPAKMY